MNDLNTRLTALGDQIQAACAASGVDVVGFTVLAKRDTTQLTTESRSRISRPEYMRALRMYVAAEETDPRRDEQPS